MLNRIPSLDGIRAIAVSMVIILHVSQRYKWPFPNTWAASLLVGRGGGMWTGDGVGIFFVLSGFLITTLLVNEYDKRNRIDLGSFYFRRAFRILPPLFAYILVAFAFCLYEHIKFSPQNFLSSLFFYRDYYFGPDLWVTQHTWSLSVEEQFYLLWPVPMYWLLRKKGRTAAAKFAAALIIATPVLRVCGRFLHVPGWAHHEDVMFHCRMDALMCGCFVALCVGLPKFERFYENTARFWWIFPLEFLGLSLVLGNQIGINYRKSFGLTLDSIAIALFILWATRNPHHWVGRILNCRLFVSVGLLSYSIYLWQTFFIHPENATVMGTFPWFPPFLCLAAYLSYRLVEKPALLLKTGILKRSLAFRQRRSESPVVLNG